MPIPTDSLTERRKAEAAGRVVLKVLTLMPDSAPAAMLLELLEAGIHDPEDRALFGFAPRRNPDAGSVPATLTRSPTLSGGAAAIAE
jgi:hypothetical protein